MSLQPSKYREILLSFDFRRCCADKLFDTILNNAKKCYTHTCKGHQFADK